MPADNAAAIDLLLWQGRGDVSWSRGATLDLPRTVSAATDALNDHLRVSEAPWLLFWDPRLGQPDGEVLDELVAGRADLWHGGLSLGLAGQPDEQDYVNPIWPLNCDVPADQQAVSWRCHPAAVLVRADVLRRLGGLDAAYDTPVGAFLDLGRRAVERGAVPFHAPRLVPPGRRIPGGLSEVDRCVFLVRTFARKWATYASVRRALARRRPRAVRAALLDARARCARVPRPGEGVVVERAPVPIEGDEPKVTVVLPTLGRYEYVGPLLHQLRTQTIRPVQVIVVDQNDPDKRDHELYEGFADLDLEVIFQDQKGQWLARNAAIERGTGDWLVFLDDDSEIEPDFIERHYEGLKRYDADLSTGASLAVVGAPVPDNYAFFRVADQWDSGNGMCHRDLLRRLGAFDQQFDRMRRGDAEFGLRTQLSGGLVVHNPHATRVHLKAAAGGLRTFDTWDAFRMRSRKGPLPLPSVVYYAKRYHTRRQQREDLLIGLSQSVIPYELKRRASLAQWAKFVAVELVFLPVTLGRVRQSLREADRMLAEGPRIPAVS